jgi:hypothetical protein
MQRITAKSSRDYSYTVIHGVRTAPAIAVGMTVSLSYLDTPDNALQTVQRLHPDVEITGVTEYIAS